MMIHGQEISESELKVIWGAICDRIPINSWVKIEKNYDKTVAAIKHFIDRRKDEYSSPFCLSFNSDFTMFRKTQFIKPVPVHKKLRRKEDLDK